MYNPMELAEMVNSANYASMSYGELVTIDFALHLAIGEVKPLVEIKKQEEMAVHTHEYVAKMKRYCATKEEILACIEKEMVETAPNFSITQHDVDDQAPMVDSENDQEKGEEVLSLPSPTTSIMDDIDLYEYWESLAQGAPQEDESQSATPEREEGERNLTESESVEIVAAPVTDETESRAPIVPEIKEKTLVEEALEMMNPLPVPSNIDSDAPYYYTCYFSYGDNGELVHSDPSGKNLRTSKELEEFRTSVETYYRLYKKYTILSSTGDHLVYRDGMNSYRIMLYHFTEEKRECVEMPEQRTESVCNPIGEDKTKVLKKKNALIRKAIKLAKEYSNSDGTEVHTPFYEEYIFTLGWNHKLKFLKKRERVYEDTATLIELMPAFESYAKLFFDNYVVLSKDNCVGAMSEKTIHLIRFNIPTQEKKKRAIKKSKPVTKEISELEKPMPVTSTLPAKGVNNLLLNAVEMSKNLPVAKGTDINTPYFVQHDFCVTNEGNLIFTGKPYSQNASIEMLCRYRENHRKYAKAMKASQIVSTDTHTAFIRNNGNNVCVYSYHV